VSFAAPEALLYLETLAGEIGSALESTRMSEAIGRAEMQMEMQAIAHPASRAKLRVGDFLTENRVVFLPAGLSREQVFQELIRHLLLCNPAQALQAILERERSGPTQIGPSLTIPHARLPGAKSLRAALGISPDGPSRLTLLFISPADNTHSHLAFLASVCTLFRTDALADALLTKKTPPEVLDYLRQSEIPG
jgi:mannitol/fructose-specific phosphotransferase system IIA component (Ntr-type)